MEEKFGMRNAEFGMKNEENGFVESGTNSYCTRAEFTPRGTRAEFGMQNEENGFVESGTNSYCARAELTPRGTRAECGMENEENCFIDNESHSSDTELEVQPEGLGEKSENSGTEAENASQDSCDTEAQGEGQDPCDRSEAKGSSYETGAEGDNQENQLQDLLSELEAERARRIQAENKYECIRYLEEKGLPLSLVNVIGENSLDAMKGAIDTLSQIVGERVRDEVKSRLTSVTPPPARSMSPSYSDFQKMSLGDMQKIYSTDKQLYRELTNQFKK